MRVAAASLPRAEVTLGRRANAAQFTLLVVVNAFVGAMVGLERTILPALAESEFHVIARSAILSFIVVFGLTKAVTNYAAGRLSDRLGRKRILVAGWLVAVPVPFLGMQAVGIGAIAVAQSGWEFATGSVMLGIGTAMVYPTLLAAIGDVASPAWRASSIGVYRLWRDLGHAVGALLTGITADLLGVSAALRLVAALTAASGLIATWRMTETSRRPLFVSA